MTAPTIVASTGRESAALKAARLLVEGRVRLRLVKVGRCWARVNGTTAVYDVGCVHGQWHCSCASYGKGCAHIRAVQAIVDLSGPKET
jgi:hypothetical protein